MKKKSYATITIIFCLLLVTAGCNNSKQDIKLHKPAMEVPAAFSKNDAVKEYFLALDGVVNEYVHMIENMAITSKEAKNTEDEDFGAAMNMLASASGSMMKMAPLLEKMEKLQKDAEVLKDNMSREELKVFTESYIKLIKRFQEASLKINNNS